MRSIHLTCRWRPDSVLKRAACLAVCLLGLLVVASHARANGNPVPARIQTPPDAPLLSSPSNNSYATVHDVIFIWYPAQAYAPAELVAYELIVDSGTYTVTAPATSITVHELTNGPHAWQVRSLDSAGSYSSWSATWAFTIDDEPPPIPAQISPSDASAVSNHRVTYDWDPSIDTGGSGLATYEIQLDERNYVVSATSSQYIASWQANGPHTWQVRARDRANNYSAYSPLWVVVVDDTAPLSPILTSPADGSVVPNSEIILRWYPATDSYSGVARHEVILDGAVHSVPAPTAEYVAAGLPGGTHTWKVRAVDRAGNVGGDSEVRTVIVIGPPWPAPVQTSPPDGSATADLRPTFAWLSPGDNEGVGVAGYEIVLDGTPHSVTDASYQPGTGLANGSHAWKVRAFDQNGSAGPYSALWSLLVDDQPPDAPMPTHPADGAATYNRRPAFGWQAALDHGPAGVQSYEITIDGDPAYVDAQTTAYTPPNPLADGTHHWQLRSLDRTGNTSLYSAEWQLIVDNQLPATPDLVSPPDNAITRSSAPAFSWIAAADQGPAGIGYYGLQIDSTLFVAASPSYTVPGLGDGAHSWLVCAVDRAGNVGAYSASRTLIVDTQPPGIPLLVAPPDGQVTNANRPALAWQPVADVGLAGLRDYTVKLDGVEHIVDGTSYTVPGLGDGPHSWQARANDRAGNAGSYTPERTLVIDTRPPAPSLAAPTKPCPGRFLLGWGATDPAPSSGIVGYAVAYRENDGPWHPWLTDTRQTSAEFISDTTAVNLTFRLTAFDRAGNSASVARSIQTDGHWLFLPCLARGFPER